VRLRHDRLDVLDRAGLEEHVRDRDEQRPLVDRVDYAFVVGRDQDVRPAPFLRLIEVAHRREVALLVDDPPARAVEAEARDDDGLRERHVLVHRDRAGRSADQPRDLVADRQRHLPPALLPGPDAARVPRSRVLEQALLGGRGHGAERVVDQVGALREDREARAVVEETGHRPRV
jgi:hypothetical protein